MCATCGCSVPHVHAQPAGRTVLLEQDILAKNNRLAERNRAWFASRRIAAFNLMSSPGSGKTTLLERTIDPPRGSLLFIEDVGNLVCPALLRSRRGAQGGDRLGDRRR